MISLNLAWMYITDRADTWRIAVADSRLVESLVLSEYWEMIKWFANGLFIGSTIIMISPAVASQSIVPWVMYLLANTVWFVDSAWTSNKPWFWMAAFFIVWDVVLIVSRLV
jgi:hypothetical protein